MGYAGARLRQLWPEPCTCTVRFLSVPITAVSAVVIKTLALHSGFCELCGYDCPHGGHSKSHSNSRTSRHFHSKEWT